MHPRDMRCQIIDALTKASAAGLRIGWEDSGLQNASAIAGEL